MKRKFTIFIDEEIIKKTKICALEQNTTASAVIEEQLRNYTNFREETNDEYNTN